MTFFTRLMSLGLLVSLGHAANWDAHHVLVRLDRPTTLEEARTLLDGKDWQVSRVLVPRLDIFLLALTDGRGVEESLRSLCRLPQVRWAQADHFTQDRVQPDDAEFSQMWNLQQVTDADVDAPEAWDVATGGTDPLGRDIVVAVVDGGMDLNHPDLMPNKWTNTGEIPGNGLDDEGNGFADDVNGWDAYANDGTPPFNGHGTHVSGIIGAKGNNLLQVVGLNWDVDLLTVAGSSSQTSIVSIAYNYVLEQKTQWLETGGQRGANIVVTNSSFGVNFGNCSTGEYPVWNDLYDAMGQVGILSATATMNTNANVDLQGDIPTSCPSPWLVTVTNTTSTDLRNPGAAYGATCIDIGAPGTAVHSTYLNNSTANLTGTSMASPHLAGAIALVHAAMSDSLAHLVEADPAAGALVIKDIILSTVDPLVDLQGITVSGGRLNLHGAVMAASQWPPAAEMVLSISRTADARLLLDWTPMSGATAYHVEWRGEEGDSWQRMETVAASPWQSVPQPPEARGQFRVVAELP